MRQHLVLAIVLVLLLQAAATAAIVGAFPAAAQFSTAADPNRLFATSANQGIIAIDPTSGLVLNTFAPPETLGVNDSLAFDGTTLYYLSGSWDANTLYALDPDSGTVIDSYALPASGFRNGLAAMNGMVYILEWSVLAQDIRVFDPATETTVGILDIDGTNPSAPLIGGGLAAIREPAALLVTTNDPDAPDEILEIDTVTGEITRRFEHGLGSGVLGVGVVNGEIYLGHNTDNTLTIYNRDGTILRTLTVPGSVGFQSLGADDVILAIDIDKQASPQGAVNRGDWLTYTVSISTTPGSQLGVYDPLEGTTFAGFVPPLPAGIVHENGVITGTLIVTPTPRITLTFVVEVSAGATVSVTNRACAYALPNTINRCQWSTPVSNPVRDAPGTPVQLWPTDNTVTSSLPITFTWQPASGWPADGYNVDIDGAIVTTTQTAWPAYLSLGVHTWTVRAFNSAGYSAWAPLHTLQIDEGPLPPGAPVLLSPPNGTVTSTKAITFTWQPGVGGPADGYSLNLDGTWITTTATVWPASLTPGLHTWTVRAYNDAGYSPLPEPWQLEVKGFRVYLPLLLRAP